MQNIDFDNYLLFMEVNTEFYGKYAKYSVNHYVNTKLLNIGVYIAISILPPADEKIIS